MPTNLFEVAPVSFNVLLAGGAGSAQCGWEEGKEGLLCWHIHNLDFRSSRKEGTNLRLERKDDEENGMGRQGTKTGWDHGLIYAVSHEPTGRSKRGSFRKQGSRSSRARLPPKELGVDNGCRRRKHQSAEAQKTPPGRLAGELKKRG
jgi:hypothetical protein